MTGIDIAPINETRKENQQSETSANTTEVPRIPRGCEHFQTNNSNNLGKWINS
jgi:hypothetical protein